MEITFSIMILIHCRSSDENSVLVEGPTYYKQRLKVKIWKSASVPGIRL
jgi:hypothetical protein